MTTTWEQNMARLANRSLAIEAEIPDEILRGIYKGQRRPVDDDLEDLLARGRFALLWGTHRTGKTTAACKWLFRERMRRAVSKNPILAGKTFSAYFIDAKVYCDLKKWEEPYIKTHSCMALVLDEVGRERWPDSLAWLLRDRFNRTYSTTILTTNLTAQAFRKRYGDHIWLRMMEQGGEIEVTA